MYSRLKAAMLFYHLTICSKISKIFTNTIRKIKQTIGSIFKKIISISIDDQNLLPCELKSSNSVSTFKESLTLFVTNHQLN